MTPGAPGGGYSANTVRYDHTADSGDRFTPGDVLWLDGPIAGLPYPAGFWVLCEITEARAWVSLCGAHDGQNAGIANWYEISTEDLQAFKSTGQRALIRGIRDDAD